MTKETIEQIKTLAEKEGYKLSEKVIRTRDCTNFKDNTQISRYIVEMEFEKTK